MVKGFLATCTLQFLMMLVVRFSLTSTWLRDHVRNTHAVHFSTTDLREHQFGRQAHQRGYSIKEQRVRLKERSTRRFLIILHLAVHMNSTSSTNSTTGRRSSTVLPPRETLIRLLSSPEETWVLQQMRKLRVNR